MAEWAGVHRTLVVLGVDDEADLLAWEGKIKAAGGICEAFVEPDIGDQKTALAVHPSVDQAIFRGLTLYNPLQAGPKAKAA